MDKFCPFCPFNLVIAKRAPKRGSNQILPTAGYLNILLFPQLDLLPSHVLGAYLTFMTLLFLQNSIEKCSIRLSFVNSGLIGAMD